MTRPSLRPGPRTPASDPSAARSRDFTGTALRLSATLRPHRWSLASVLAMSITGIGLSVIGPRVLGHATDLLFNGVIGRQLPVGITKAQAIDDARPGAIKSLPICCRE